MRTAWLGGLALLLSVPAVSQNPGIITTIAGTGVGGYSGDGGPSVRAQLNLGFRTEDDFYFYSHPAVDSAGNIYIADTLNARVRRISPDGVISTVAGDGNEGFSNGATATQSSLWVPAAVALDSAGNLYIADQFNSRVRRVTPDGKIATFAGNGDYAFAGNGGPAGQAALSLPGGVAVGPDGYVYVSDTFNDQVRRVGPDGRILAYAGADRLSIDYDYGGDGGPAIEAAILLPAGLAFDRAGNLYIADQYNNRIRKVTPGSALITTVAGDGLAGFSGDGGPATRASLNHPSDVAFDAAGNLYIADQFNNRVRKMTPEGIITTVAGNGVHGYGGDGGSPLAAALDFPSGLTFDNQGNLLIVDHHNQRLRRVVFNAPSLVGAPARLEFAGIAGGADPATQSFSLSNPGAGSLGFVITSDSPWLSATPASGSAAGAPVTVTVRVTLANLREGQYAGTLTVRAAEAAIREQVIAVSVTVRPAAAPAPSFTSAGVAHAASFAVGAVAPGEIISIFGSNLGPEAALPSALDPATGRVATNRGGVSVLFNDLPGALFFVQRGQINVQVPYELAGATTARVVVRYLEGASAPVSVPVVAASPGIFAVNAGRGQAALLNEDSSTNAASNPAAAGRAVQIFLTGQGRTEPPVATGQLPAAPFPQPALPVTVAIGGRVARILFAGLAPGLAGLLQVNAVVPEETAPGDNVSLTVSVGETSSQAGVTLAVRGR